MAPLAGITDAPYRRLCRRYGACLVYTEMISAKGLYYGDRKTEELLVIREEEQPVAIQIFGNDPELMAWAAGQLERRKNVLLDVNMGCPVPKVVKNGDGSALLRDPDRIYRIIAAMTAVTDKPVTAKIRLGIDGEDRAIEAAQAIEAGGGSAVAVHGRTREAFYSGQADWSRIAAVKKAVSIPVIGNGDVVDGPSAMALLDQTGCDMVMVGRAALGNPWIFQELVAAWRGEEPPQPPALEERKAVMSEHLADLASLKGEYAAVREMRKFAGWYFRGIPGSVAFRGKVNTITDIQALQEAIANLGGK